MSRTSTNLTNSIANHKGQRSEPLSRSIDQLAMAPSLIKLVSLVAAVLLLATPQARGWAPVDDQVSDMVPVRTPAEQVLVAITGGAGTMAGAPLCLQCRCCSRSSPSNCQITTCCSSFNCNPAGKCNLVQGKCGCTGC